MLYVVTVANVLAADRVDEFDLWEIQILVRAENPKAALLEAELFSRSSDTWKRLGYPSEPVLHAVRNVHDELLCDGSLLSSLSQARLPQRLLVTRIGEVEEKELEALRHFHHIQLPYGFIYIDQQHQ